MFERNIIDLVGLFVENVQSLYPFLEDPPGRHCGPGAPAHNMVPATRPLGRCPHSKPKTQRVELLHCLRKMKISGVSSRWLPVGSHACSLPLPPEPETHWQRVKIQRFIIRLHILPELPMPLLTYRKICYLHQGEIKQDPV